MADEWFIERKTGISGPYTASKLKSLAAQGRISPGDLVRRGSDGKTVPASRVTGLFAAPKANASAKAVPPPLPGADAKSAARAEPLGRSSAVTERVEARPRQSQEPSEPFFVSAETAGFGQLLPSVFLSKFSMPPYAISLTVLILLVLVVVRNGSFTFAVAFCLASLVYFDATANKIGLIPPRTWFSANMSAGMWATMTVLLWPLVLPVYLLKRPHLIQTAVERPQSARARKLTLGVLGVWTALLFLASVGQSEHRLNNSANSQTNALEAVIGRPQQQPGVAKNKLPDDKAPEVLTADFLPHEVGRTLEYIWILLPSKPPSMMSHMLRTDRPDGWSDEKWLKLATRGKDESLPLPDDLSHNRQHRRINNRTGFVEVGDEDDPKLKVEMHYSPEIKIGGKVGDSWTDAIAKDLRSTFKVMAFRHRTVEGRRRVTALIRETTTSGTEVIQVTREYARGVGLIFQAGKDKGELTHVRALASLGLETGPGSPRVEDYLAEIEKSGVPDPVLGGAEHKKQPVAPQEVEDTGPPATCDSLLKRIGKMQGLAEWNISNFANTGMYDRCAAYSSLPVPASFSSHKVHWLHAVRDKSRPRRHKMESVLKALGVPNERVPNLDYRQDGGTKVEVWIYKLPDGEIRIPMTVLPSLARIAPSGYRLDASQTVDRVVFSGPGVEVFSN